MFIFGFIVGILATLAAAKFFAAKVMINVYRSPYNFDRTVEELKKRAEEMGWRVPAIHDFGGTIREIKGEDIGKVKVIEICKPDYTMEMLKDDEDKFISAFLPCGIGVYEKRDGSVFVARRNVKLFALMFGGRIGKALKKAAKEEDKISSFLG